MLKSRSLSLLLVASGVGSFGWYACSSDDSGDKTYTVSPGAGGSSSNSAGGSDQAGGSAGNTSTGSTGGGGSNSDTGGSSGVGGATTGTGGTAGTGGTGGGTGMSDAGGAMPEAGDANKVVLFDGSAASFNSWASVRNGGNNPWKNNGDGTMTVITNTGDIQSKQKFQDLFVHVEYKTPMLPASVTGQERGNSGIYLKGSYEMQVLDTYGQPPAIDGCGAVYSIQKPLVTACYEQEKWNTYEIEFKAQVCNAQMQKTANARMVKVTLNGTLVQQDVEVPHLTTAGQQEDCAPKGLLLQDHYSVLPVSYRNIWVIPRN